MLKRSILIAGLGIFGLWSAQEQCTPQEAGNTIGDTGCVSFTYRNQTVFYQTVRAADGNEWLQQNLGSTNVAENIADENARGDYFQWGRWDDGHQLKDSEMSEEYPTPNNPLGLGEGTDKFYINGGSPWNSDYTGWFANPGQNDTWNAKNLAEVTEHNGMDPCKAIGENWEIPTEEVWDIALQKENIFPKPEGATNNGITRAFESNLKIPGAGARKDDSFAFEGQRAYLWTKSASENPNFYRYVYLGTYAGSTNGFGGDAKSHGYSIRCVNTSNNTLGIQNVKSTNLNIAPNPVSKYFTVTATANILKIEIINTAGQKVKVTKEADNINVSELKNGVYYVNVTFENGKTETKKIIKK